MSYQDWVKSNGSVLTLFLFDRVHGGWVFTDDDDKIYRDPLPVLELDLESEPFYDDDDDEDDVDGFQRF